MKLGGLTPLLRDEGFFLDRFEHAYKLQFAALILGDTFFLVTPSGHYSYPHIFQIGTQG